LSLDLRADGWILGIDTAVGIGSLALLPLSPVSPGRFGAEPPLTLPLPDAHSENLPEQLQTLLNHHSLGVHSLVMVAVVTGPGSFAGVRVGLAFAKGLAETLEIPALGFSTLQVMAAAASGQLRVPVIDGRRGEIFSAIYDGTGKALVPDQVTIWAAWQDSISDAGATLEDVVVLSGFDPTEGSAQQVQNLALPAAQLALQSASRMVDEQNGRFGAADLLDAHYVRRNDAAGQWTDSVISGFSLDRPEIDSTRAS
jgi:tRNA threonylcarbamoyl adenosine modification protein YeaZ